MSRPKCISVLHTIICKPLPIGGSGLRENDTFQGQTIVLKYVLFLSEKASTLQLKGKNWPPEGANSYR